MASLADEQRHDIVIDGVMVHVSQKMRTSAGYSKEFRRIILDVIRHLFSLEDRPSLTPWTGIHAIAFKALNGCAPNIADDVKNARECKDAVGSLVRSVLGSKANSSNDNIQRAFPAKAFTYCIENAGLDMNDFKLFWVNRTKGKGGGNVKDAPQGKVEERFVQTVARVKNNNNNNNININNNNKGFRV